MIRDEDTLMNPPLEELLDQIPQKYELVLTATRRAKQIIRELRLNPLGIDESLRQRKPLSIALMDISSGRVDKTALLAPDIEFDEIEHEQPDFFGDPERLSHELDHPQSRASYTTQEGEDASTEVVDELELDWQVESKDEEEEVNELDLDWKGGAEDE